MSEEQASELEALGCSASLPKMMCYNKVQWGYALMFAIVDFVGQNLLIISF